MAPEGGTSGFSKSGLVVRQLQVWCSSPTTSAGCGGFGWRLARECSPVNVLQRHVSCCLQEACSSTQKSCKVMVFPWIGWWWRLARECSPVNVLQRHVSCCLQEACSSTQKSCKVMVFPWIGWWWRLRFFTCFSYFRWIFLGSTIFFFGCSFPFFFPSSFTYFYLFVLSFIFILFSHKCPSFPPLSQFVYSEHYCHNLWSYIYICTNNVYIYELKKAHEV